MGRGVSIIAGDKVFASKKEAISFYKKILDSYNFKEILTPDDAEAIISLAFKDEDLSAESVSEFSKACVYNVQYDDEYLDEQNKIYGVMVDRHPDYRTTKCFFILAKENGVETRFIFSYRAEIYGYMSTEMKFIRACRLSIEERLREFKIKQFKNRPVKCAVSGRTVEWEECQVDHKAPLTFSVIVKSFIVANSINIEEVTYRYSNEESAKGYFSNQELSKKFHDFHKQMAVLRILSIKENTKRSSAARIKPSKKDGVLDHS